MTKTISERLRALVAFYDDFPPNSEFRTVLKKAADEIERLERYIEALESVTDSHGLQMAQAKLRVTGVP